MTKPFDCSMQDPVNCWIKYLDKKPTDRKEEIEIRKVLEDLPKKPLTFTNNVMRLATSKGEIFLEVTDEWREGILKGKAKKIIITLTESIEDITLDDGKGTDYNDYSGRWTGLYQ